MQKMARRMLVSLSVLVVLLSGMTPIALSADSQTLGNGQSGLREMLSEAGAPTNGSGKWYFLILNADDRGFTLAGPFKTPLDCYDISEWAKKQRGTVSRCWNGGE